LRIGKRDFFGRLAPLATFARTIVATTILLTASGIESYEILANRMGCFLCLDQSGSVVREGVVDSRHGR
jgi:hypothetical protein